MRAASLKGSGALYVPTSRKKAPPAPPAPPPIPAELARLRAVEFFRTVRWTLDPVPAAPAAPQPRLLTLDPTASARRVFALVAWEGAKPAAPPPESPLSVKLIFSAFKWENA